MTLLRWALGCAAAVGLALSATTANAGWFDRDRDGGCSVKDGPCSALSWTGFYVGTHGGFGSADSRLRDVDSYNGAVGSSFGYSGTGTLAGVQLGYNWQRQRLLLGIEGEIGWADIDATGQAPVIAALGRPADDSSARLEVDRYATLAGRLGLVVFDKVLIYGKAGWGWVRTDASFIDTNTGGTTLTSGTSAHDTLDGPVWGGGVELALNHWLSVKAEFLRFQLDDTITHTATRSTGGTFRFAHDVDDLDTVKFGVNIKFGSREPAAPLK